MDKTRAELFLVLSFVVAGGVLAYGFSFRYRAYVDEYTYARLGYSLAQGHLASDSTFLGIYRGYGLVTNSIITPFGYLDSVEPWLDHPPLVGILLVPFALAGANLRLLPVMLYSAMTFVLYLALAKFDRAWAVLTVLVSEAYVMTYPVLSMLFLDSAVSFFLVLTMAAIIRHSKTGSRTTLYVAGVSAGLAALSKVPGVSAILLLTVYVAYLCVSKRAKARQAFPPALLSVAIGAAWPVASFLAEPGLFWRLSVENFSRSVASDSPISQVLASLVSSATFFKDNYTTAIDPILVVSWFAVAYAIISRRLWLGGLALASYLLVLLVLRYAPPQMTIPLYPFYSISIAAVMAQGVRLARDRFAGRRVIHPTR